MTWTSCSHALASGVPKVSQLGMVGLVVGIGNAATGMTVAEAERYVVGFHDFAVSVNACEKFPKSVGGTPFRHDGAAAQYDAGEAVGGHRYAAFLITPACM